MPDPGRRARSERIEGKTAASSIGLRIVEFALVKTFCDFDSIRMNSLPAQSCNLTDPQRTDYHQRDNVFRPLRQVVDHTSYVLFREHYPRIPCLFPRQT